MSAASSLFYIADDYPRLVQRVRRLQKNTAHVEYPHSKCCRLISNVRLLGGDDDSFDVESKFVTYRSKNGILETYLGHHTYELRLAKAGLRIRNKRSQLDLDHIREQGKVSIIL
ncbi:aromatic-ring-hydroxylating dioxygenase subunit beta [Phenylobacterium sp. J426]|uniref:aromatic-ring-hydroxylating dioxygenase subunit beta n=1 Tax=Phenylobacterium sp. J426 TaxID=2898439 RepID=UPI0035AE0A51